MSDQTSIPTRTYVKLERTLNEINIKLRRDELNSTVSEKDMMAFMGWKGKNSVYDALRDGLIPAEAYVTLVNNKRRYFLDKLIKKQA